jgi:hypothetical protein
METVSVGSNTVVFTAIMHEDGENYAIKSINKVPIIENPRSLLSLTNEIDVMR